MHRSSRLLLFAAMATLATAAVLAMSVIPPVRADAFPGAAPERAVPAFWVNAILNVLVAARALSASRLGDGAPTRRRVWTGVAGVIALLLGLALIDAAVAFRAHGPAMQGAVVALWVCVCLDLAGGVSMLVSTFLQRVRSTGRA